MTQGQILRTNYRATGGIAGITALGGAIAKIQLSAAGAQTLQPYGGVIFFTSYFVSAHLTAGIIADSAFGMMSAFYGAGVYDSGYAIQPVVVVPLSVSDILIRSALVAASFRTSGSCALFNCYANASIAAASTADLVFTMLGLVISGP